MPGTHRVAVVLDPELGGEITAMAGRHHVWAVRSPANQAAVDVFARGESDHDLEKGITLFTSEGTNREDEFLSILPTVEEHHGVDSHDPPLGVLEVYGTQVTDPIARELDSLGFTRIEPREAGFVAARDNA